VSGKFNKKAAVITVVIFGIFFFIGLYFTVNDILFRSNSIVTDGTITNFIEEPNGGGVSYCPVFVYDDINGAEYEERSSLCSLPAEGKIGQKVKVIYSKKNYSVAKIDRWSDNLFNPIFAMIGLLGMVSAIVLIKKYGKSEI
jgi:hypothetical protein